MTKQWKINNLEKKNEKLAEENRGLKEQIKLLNSQIERLEAVEKYYNKKTELLEKTKNEYETLILFYGTGWLYRRK